MRKRRWAFGTLALWAALLLCAASDLRAQAALQAPAERLTRNMLSARFKNVGITDEFFNSGVSTGQYLIYPNNGGGSYVNIRLKDTASSNIEAYSFAVRAGHGVWTMTSDQRVVYSGVRVGMQAGNILPMQYDVSADPDLSKLGRQYYSHRRAAVKLGYGDRTLGGVAQTSLGGNWWPGSDLIEVGKKTDPFGRPPVHINNFNLSTYPTDDTWPEEIIVTRWTNSQGITITQRAFAWSHPDFDDLYIDEYILENTGDKTGDGKRDLPETALNNLFIGFQDRFNNSAQGQQLYRQYWKDDRDWGMDDWYVYDPKLKLMYEWDGDHPRYNDWNDAGDPYKDAFALGTLVNGAKIGQGEGTLMSPAHLGVGVVAYTDDPASPYAFNTRDRNKGYVAPDGDQPYAVRFWGAFEKDVQDDPNNLKMSEAQMYSEVLGKGRTIDPNPARPSGQFSMLIFGPYNLPPSGKAKVVLAYVAGHPGQVLGNTDVFTWARKGNQAELPRGLDALKQNLEAARFVYANAYDTPDAPPDVNFRTGSNSTANMTVDWPVEVENATHPDYVGAEAKDIAGYRVYRSTWFDVGPWELIADIPAGTASQQTTAYRVTRDNTLYTFEDLQSVAGFFYHYSVRPYAKGHKTWSGGNPNSPLDMGRLPKHIVTNVERGQEGGWAAPTQRIYADESPFAIPSAKTEALEQRVRVVPNPYYLSSDHSYPGSTKIRFVGIPSRCRIQVFSVSGEKVSDYLHNDPGKGESDYDQITWAYNGQIATGVYFWVVENLIQGPSFGKTQGGTLMVIR